MAHITRDRTPGVAEAAPVGARLLRVVQLGPALKKQCGALSLPLHHLTNPGPCHLLPSPPQPPPTLHLPQGDDYILYCHPSKQKTPRSDRLRAWYHDMLRKARAEGSVAHVGTLWDTYFPGGRDHRLEKASITQIPYLDGDYWPGELTGGKGAAGGTQGSGRVGWGVCGDYWPAGPSEGPGTRGLCCGVGEGRGRGYGMGWGARVMGTGHKGSQGNKGRGRGGGGAWQGGMLGMDQWWGGIPDIPPAPNSWDCVAAFHAHPLTPCPFLPRPPTLSHHAPPGEAENLLATIVDGQRAAAAKANAVAGGGRKAPSKGKRYLAGASTDEQLMSKLGDVLGGNMKEDFMVVHLQVRAGGGGVV